MNSVKMKLTGLLVSSVLLAATTSTHAQNVTVNCTGNGGPNADIKRGRVSSVLNPSKIAEIAGLGFQLYALHQDLPANNIATEQPLTEFYMNGSTLSTRVDADVVSARQAVYAAGYQLIYQATGTPYYGVTPSGGTTTTQLSGLPIDTSRAWTGTIPSNWYPLPAAGYRVPFGQALAAWMQQVESSDGASKAIWIGTQEPSHTVGFPGGVSTQAEVLNNIDLYITTWKPTAVAMTNAGFQMGGIQLNQANISNTTIATHAVAQLKSTNCPFNYFTIQQYKPETTNTSVLNNIRTALTNNSYATAKKVLFNRYNMQNSSFPGTTSTYGSFFDAEKVLLDNADMVYGYCYEGGNALTDTRLQQVMKFMNEFSVNRRPVTLTSGLKCIATSENAKLKMIVWNPGSSSVAVNILLNNRPSTWTTKTLTVRVANNSGGLTTSTTATWNTSTNRIANFSIAAGSFALIALN